jgi:hypothetical protein
LSGEKNLLNVIKNDKTAGWGFVQSAVASVPQLRFGIWENRV